MVSGRWGWADCWNESLLGWTFLGLAAHLLQRHTDHLAISPWCPGVVAWRPGTSLCITTADLLVGKDARRLHRAGG